MACEESVLERGRTVSSNPITPSMRGFPVCDKLRDALRRNSSWTGNGLPTGSFEIAERRGQMGGLRA